MMPVFSNVPHLGQIGFDDIPRAAVVGVGSEVDVVVVVASPVTDNAFILVVGVLVVDVVVVVTHTICDIRPDDPTNMSSFSAFECTQASPHRICLNEVAP